ncbi:MAG TPA: BON domain-containing protein, partial [Chryseosolibacter sp.]
MKSEDQIQKEVITEIQLDPQLSSVASGIKVSVKQGVVTLSGVVDEYSQRFAAEDAAHRISGVKVVAVDIAVKENESLEQIADSTLAENIRSALVWHSGLNEDRIGIKVDEGWVYLEGHLNWDYERKAALNAIESIRGVKGIIDKIKINSKTVQSRQIKRRIGE